MSKVFLMRAKTYNELMALGAITNTDTSTGKLAGIPVNIAKRHELEENVIAWTES